MERCNRMAWRTYPNGYRVCRDHAHVNDPAETLHENTVGPCDYPTDGHGAMRYDRRMRLARIAKDR
jgi:hypothetical protein